MRLIPAIDLRSRRTVRLRGGDYGDEIAYGESPVDAARRFAAAGARELHVVDLDGARSGRPEQLDVVAAIRGEVGVEIELGGGLRTLDDLRSAAAIGVDRLVIGTAAIADPELLRAAVAEFGDRLVVSVDARGGKVEAEGWTEASGLAVRDLLDRLEAEGVNAFVYSAIERDGMMSGPALDEARSVSESANCGFVYAGGVASLDDLAALRGLSLPNLSGVIVGRALHEGVFTVQDGIAALGA